MQTKTAMAVSSFIWSIAAMPLGVVSVNASAGECTHPLFPSDALYIAGNSPASVATADLDGSC